MLTFNNRGGGKVIWGIADTHPPTIKNPPIPKNRAHGTRGRSPIFLGDAPTHLEHCPPPSNELGRHGGRDPDLRPVLSDLS